MALTQSNTLWIVVQIARVLCERQDNMRTNTVQIQTSFHAGPGPLQGNLALTQQALQDFGLATLQILAKVKALYDAHPTELTAMAAAPLPTFAQLQADYTLLHTWATNMNTVTLASGADLDTKVAALLVAVPALVLPF